MATAYFPLNPGSLVLPNHVDLLASASAWLGVDTGSAGNYAVAFDGSSPNFNALPTLNTGLTLQFVATSSSVAGGSTLTVVGASRTFNPVPITKLGGQQALGVGDIVAGQIVSVLYNSNGGSPRFELVGSGPASVGATGAAGATGVTGPSQGVTGPTGATGPAPPSPMVCVGPVAATGNNPFSIDFYQNYAYVANFAGSISQFSLGPLGSLTPMGLAATGIDYCSGLVIHGNVLYASVWGNNTILQYSIGAAGALTLVGTAASTGLTNPYALAINGNNLYVVNRTGSSLSIFAIAADGSLTAAGTTANSNNNVDLTFAGGYAYVASSGNNGTAQISQMSIAADGTLSLVAARPCPNDQPYGIASTSTHLYVVGNNDNTLTRYFINPDGSLTLTCTIPLDPNGPAGIGIQNGFAYVSCSTSNRLWQYSLPESNP